MRRVVQHGALFIILIIFLSPSASLFAATQARPPYLDEPVKLEIIGRLEAGEKYPLVIFLPFTTGSASIYYSRVAPYVGLENYLAIIPQGAVETGDYLPDFFSYIKWYEQRLLTDLQEIMKNYPVDPARIYVTGFSVGGDLSWALMIRRKELLAGALILGSRCSYAPTQKDLKYLKEHKKRIVLLIGNEDLPERVRGMEAASKLSEKNGLTYWHWQFGGEHIIPPTEMKRAFDLLMGKNGSETAATVPQPHKTAAKAGGAIILYGRKSCVMCQDMQTNLNKVGIDYVFYDIDADNQRSLEMWQKVHESFPDVENIRFPIVDIYGLILISPSFDEVRRYR